MSSLSLTDEERKAMVGRQRWRPGLVTLLLAIVLVPLGVAGYMLVGDVAELNDDRSAARDFVPQAERRIATIRLRAALADERAWTIVGLGVDGLRLDDQDLGGMVDVFARSRLVSSRELTDEVIVELPEFQAALDEARSIAADPTANAMVADDAYHALTTDVASTGDETAGQLQKLAAQRPDGENLLRTLALIDAIAEAELSGDGMFDSYITSRIIGTSADTEPELRDFVSDFVGEAHDAEAEIRALVGYRLAYDLANAEIDLHLAEGPAADRLQAIREADFERTLLAAADGQISSAIRLGLSEGDSDVFAVDLDDVDKIMGFIAASTSSKEAWTDLTGIVGADLEREAHRLEQVSLGEISRTRTLAVATAVLTLIITLTGAALILRSVRRLARSAQALRDGVVDDIRPCGPQEIYVAGVALAEAGANIDLVHRQAAALAAGDLSHPDLKQVAPGELGLDMKVAVDTLASSIRQREEAKSQASWEASHDNLTGLPNRSAALEQLKIVQQGNGLTVAGVLFVDLDRFKEVNDTFGHAAGDEVLIEIAHRLRPFGQMGDLVFRIGGDEFVVGLGGSVSHDQAIAVSERLVECLSEPVTVSTGEQIPVAACVGVAIREDGMTATGMLHNADVALQEAKSAGGNRVVLCTRELLESTRATNELVVDLASAASGGQFRLEYQPIVDVSGIPKALEALIRWDHPVRGTLMPDEFIGIAERTDLVLTIDRWVLSTVAAQISQWATTHPELDDIVVAVNVSGRHLNAKSFADDVLLPLRECGVNPCRLTIEITESSIADEGARVREALAGLRAEGVRIAIDDFGTGPSGITQLRLLPVDIIKVSRTFISTMTDREGEDSALVQLIVDIAHKFGAEAIAVGIETADQAKIVAEAGVDALQGLLFSQSVPPAAVPTTLAQLGGQARGFTDVEGYALVATRPH